MLSSDQVITFLAVLDHGGFSGAAKVLHRTQSSVTYAIQKLETDLGIVLFDRTVRRLTLTAQGRTLHPIARRLAREVETMQRAAEGLARGVESKILLVVEAVFPESQLLSALAGLHRRSPAVPVRVTVESVHACAESILHGGCTLGIIGPVAERYTELSSLPIGAIERIPVVAPGHPLARMAADVPEAPFSEHLQIVLSSRSNQARQQRFKLPASVVWRVNDMGLKRAALLAGLGWGRLPGHLAKPELASGRLVRLRTRRVEGVDWSLPMQLHVAWRKEEVLGPATSWLRDCFVDPLEESGGALAAAI
jgi:DNA-binding transcriptional LysR family regulator